MKSKFTKRLIGATLAGIMAVSIIPAAAFSVSAASNSYVIEQKEGGIKNATLYQYVLNQYDANKDGKLTVAEANKVTTLNIIGEKSLTSVNGIRWFPNLESLTIQNCGISIVHSDIGELENLEHLNLSYNKIEKLPTSVKGLKNLKTVDLSGNKLPYLPTNAKYWKKVTSLDLSDNSLKQICVGSLPYMTALEELDLSYNQLANNTSTLKSKLYSLKTLKNLTELNLSHNKLTSFPSDLFKGTTKMEKLDLSYNKLSYILKEVSYMKNLKQLNASNNQIHTVTTYLPKCTKLSNLNLANNELSKMPNLTSMKYLKCTGTDYYALNLCGNKLSQSTIRKYTNSKNLSSAWVKRQTTKTFVPITEFEGKPTFAMVDRTIDLSNQFTVNPSNATYKKVKYAVESISEGYNAELDGSNLKITQTDKNVTSGYAMIKIISLDGSHTESLLFVNIL